MTACTAQNAQQRHLEAYLWIDSILPVGGSMKHVFARRNSWLIFALLLVALLIISCAPQANTPILSPKLGEILELQASGQEITALPTPTPVLISTLTEDQILAGLPAEMVTALGSADPARGDQIHITAGCAGCHKLNPDETGQGPNWYHIADHAVSRVPGEGPALYLYESIVSPSKYVVPGFTDGVMPKTFAETLTQQDIADLLAFLLQQR